MSDTCRTRHFAPRVRSTVSSLLVLQLCALSACSPELDWRDTRPQGSAATAQFPCKPAAQTRQVKLAGSAVSMTLHACSAARQTFGLSYADVENPTRVNAALGELAASALANLGSRSAASGPAASPASSSSTPAIASPFHVPGSTPQPASGRLLLLGQLADGTPAHMQLVVFSRGTAVFQATVLGAIVSEEAAETFFASLRVNP